MVKGNQILTSDLVALRSINPDLIPKLRKLLFVISNSVPFKPNISRLSELIGISRVALLKYLNYLEEAGLVNLLHTEMLGTGHLRKPENIYLENSNLHFAIGFKEPQIGTLRETFFYNQLSKDHYVSFPDKGDFMIDNEFVIEVDGKSKDSAQIGKGKNRIIAADNITRGYGQKIPNPIHLITII